MKLSDITTIKTGGEAKYYFEIDELKDFDKAIDLARNENLPILVIGEGSNMLVSDGLVERVVVHLKNTQIKNTKNGNKVIVKAGAGLNWDKFVEWTVKNNFQGVECLSYIPGLVGASPVQNIGAYGQELSDTFKELEAYDTAKRKLVKFDKSDLLFGYRDSVFKRPENDGRYIIYTVTFELSIGGKSHIEYKSLKDYFAAKSISDPTLLQVRDAVIDIRKTKLEDPNNLPNAGSFFKNPVVTASVLKRLQKVYPDIPYFDFDDRFKIPAGWLIEQVKWKGKRYKDVGVSEKHALVLVNYGKGNTEQIRELASLIITDVRNKFGIDLEQEVRNY